MGAEGHAFFTHLAQIIQTEDLKSAGIGQDGSWPGHEPMQASHAAHDLNPGAKVEVVGVSQKDLDPQFLQQVLRDALHGSQRANRHEDGRFYLAVRCDELAHTASSVGRCNLEMKRHAAIVR